MNTLEYIKTALVTLRTQKVRSLLTTLGIVVGVMTVVTMIAIVEGMNRYVYKVLGTIGSNTIYIQKHKWQVMGEGDVNPEEVTKRRDLTLADAEAISGLPTVSRAVPFQNVWTGRMKIRYKTEEVQMNVITGGGFQYTSLAGFEVERGRDLLPNDLLFRRQVCLVGAYVVENLFKKGEDPLDKEITMRGRKFQIVGVLKERGSFLGENLDRVIIVPLTTLQKLFRVRGPWAGFMSLNILAQAQPGYPLEGAMEDVELLLRKRRAIRFDEENDFALNTQQMIVDVYKKLTTGVFLAMIGIASLALLVGGIGIMNIMLVSVLERVREIGVRKAVGAKRSDILKQFLIEALVLTVVGGFIGVFLGFGLAKVISSVTPLPSSMPLWSVALALGFSLLTGLFFGIYPASRAARLDPIEALRYE
jgi:putative ABC transport system permease protein